MNIAVAGHFDPAMPAALRKRHAVFVQPTGPVPPERLSRAEVLVARGHLQVDRALLDSAPSLRLIVKAGSGLDTVDTAAAATRGIRVETTPLSAGSVAELALALAIAVRRNLPPVAARLRGGDWGAKHQLTGRRVAGARLGILGFGRIGREMARLARAVGMQVAAWDRSPDAEPKRRAADALDVRFLDLPALLAWSELLSLHLPRTPETEGLLGAHELALLPPGAGLVNTGRAQVVERAALLEALRSGALGGAGLDVFWDEPLPAGDPFLALPNVICTPHVGAQTLEAMEEIGRGVVEAISRFERGAL